MSDLSLNIEKMGGGDLLSGFRAHENPQRFSAV